MSESRILLDPTAETRPPMREPRPRPPELRGRTVGVLDISKSRGDVFLDRVAERLSDLGADVRRYRKPTFARVAPEPLRRQIAEECDLVVEGLAD